MLANQKDFPFAEKIVNAMNVYKISINKNWKLVLTLIALRICL